VVMIYFLRYTDTLTYLLTLPCAGSGAVSKWVICACDSLVDFGAV